MGVLYGHLVALTTTKDTKSFIDVVIDDLYSKTPHRHSSRASFIHSQRFNNGQGEGDAAWVNLPLGACSYATMAQVLFTFSVTIVDPFALCDAFVRDTVLS